MSISTVNKVVAVKDFSISTIYKTVNREAPTIVFLHDSLGCNELWRSFPDKLTQNTGTNLFMYDRRGYGQSSPFGNEPRKTGYMETEADLLMVVLEQCNIINPILFGHSDGGTIALLAAAKYPGGIKAVITEGAHVFVEDITLDGIETAQEHYASTDLKSRLAKYHGDKTQALFDAWTQTWLSPEYRSWNIEHFLPQIICPVMVIQGVEDEFGSERQVQAIATQVSGPSEIFMVTNARHTPHRQCEDWLVEKCCAFMNGYVLP